MFYIHYLPGTSVICRPWFVSSESFSRFPKPHLARRRFRTFVVFSMLMLMRLFRPVNSYKQYVISSSLQVPVTPTPSQALYANISILEHSCINNASKHFDGDNRVVIRAAVNIKKGEHISINYSDPMWGSANRQLHLGKGMVGKRLN